MYLSRLTLNARHNRTKSELDRPYEMHRTLCNAWEDPKTARILWRPDRDTFGIVSVIVQSLTKPEWSSLDVPDEYLQAVDGPKTLILSALRENQRLRFRLRCRPCKRINTAGHPNFGKRKGLTAKKDILDWLRRKAAGNGFEVIDVAFDRIYWQDSKGGTDGKPLIGAVVFEGTLRVLDTEKFQLAIRTGVGPQKAFGFGLLSVAPA